MNQKQIQAEAPVPVPAIERLPSAARRMGVSVSQVYREVKAGRLGPLVKLGPRASGLPASAVDGWILSKIAAAEGGKQ